VETATYYLLPTQFIVYIDGGTRSNTLQHTLISLVKVNCQSDVNDQCLNSQTFSYNQCMLNFKQSNNQCIPYYHKGISIMTQLLFPPQFFTCVALKFAKDWIESPLRYSKINETSLFTIQEAY